ncbi:radical SAM protein [Roseospira marina]|uniref:Radical SAM protein n=1 Tax=Roseospira marina TaxID=140057 RepID=A0A5M6IAS1_9PROT|nr:radical SAM protein [Roseospira marina]KAA5604819.1 radical SAM protein [Roseospira marina]MBB4313511.1 uncharacterized protein [Roseospira marina]MBB5086673.1 uncharacterized protein [Roseospira marina]
MAIDDYRILWLEDDQCVLFNSLYRRVSERVPRIVGTVATLAQTGVPLSTAIQTAGVEPSLRDRVRDLILYVAGPEGEAVRPSIDPYQFHNVLVLCPASNCNLGCLYCSGTSGTDPSLRMSAEVAHDAVEFYFDNVMAADLYTLQFHGAGEPMINFPVVRQSVEHARRKATERGAKLWCRLSTNGVYSEARAQWIADNFDHVSLSLDGPPDIHNRHRPTQGGGETHETVLRTLRVFQRSGVLKRMNTVITPYSLERMVDTVDYLGRLGGIPEVRLLPMAYCGRCEITGLDRLDTRRYDALFDQAVERAAHYGMKIINLVQEVDYYTHHYCGACGFNMVVAPNGTLSTCVEVLNESNAGHEELIFGRYDSDQRRFDVDWSMIDRLRGRTSTIAEECRICAFRTNCAGNCLVRAARNTGTVYLADPETCELTKSALTRAIVELADGSVSNLMYRVSRAPQPYA